MGLLRNLFGGKARLTIEDPRFGELLLFRAQGYSSVWAGKWDIGDDKLELFVAGTEELPSPDALQWLEKLVSEPEHLDQARTAVIEVLRNADEAYVSDRFELDMALVAISVKGPGMFEISYEQRYHPHYHFNAEFVEGRSVGVSVDS